MPPGYATALARYTFGLRFPHYRELLRRNRGLYQRHRDRKRCFVIGNGPSLKTQDLRPLKDEIVIVANAFYLHPDCATVSPNYCCVGDTEFISGAPNSLAWLRKLEAALPETTLFFRPVGEAVLRQHGLFTHHKVHYAESPARPKPSEGAQIELDGPTNVGFATGTVFSIPLAIYLGFREIYLIGFDANWLADVQRGSIHFYETDPHFPHFDTTAGEGHSMELQLRSMHRLPEPSPAARQGRRAGRAHRQRHPRRLARHVSARGLRDSVRMTGRNPFRKLPLAALIDGVGDVIATSASFFAPPNPYPLSDATGLRNPGQCISLQLISDFCFAT